MMTAMQILKREYPGDDAWRNYVSAFSTGWETNPSQTKFIGKFGDHEISVVLSGLLGERSLAWFDRPTGALENLSPAEVLNGAQDGRLILRSLIMRLPV